MKPLIFLDIDGVLNSAAFLIESTGGEGVAIVEGEFDGTAHIDPTRVAKLNALITETDAEVILSSSWRLAFGLEKTLASLRARGFAHPILEVTPRMIGGDRHLEIEAFLSNHPGRRFIILDDLLEAAFGLEEHFVHVEDGLEDHHLDRARSLLLREADAAILR